jgi:alkylated DNA repair dioxygenase AlkB
LRFKIERGFIMEQLSLFGEAGQRTGLLKDFLDYRPGLFNAGESAHLINSFIKETSWKQGTIKIYDKEMISPRLTAWFGDPGNHLLYEKFPGYMPWTNELLMIKSCIEPLSGMQFNCVLLNYYRDGNDSVAWHSDKESVPGRKTVVASVSFGQTRSFDIRNKKDNKEKYSIRLENGSYLLMKAGFQDYWEHRIAKSTTPMKARVNLTFRLVG